MKEPAFAEGACLIEEGAAAGIGVESIAFAVTALGVSGSAAVQPELFADVRMSEPAVPGSVTPSTCIEPA